jgi:hypothetical protein
MRVERLPYTAEDLARNEVRLIVEFAPEDVALALGRLGQVRPVEVEGEGDE